MRSQLLFVYIHKYRNIREQGFNLSSHYHISFQAQQDGDRFTNAILSVEETSDHIQGIFHDCFTDVKGIIGENGAGKSTLLQYLSFQAHEHNGYIEHEMQPSCRDIVIYSAQSEFGEAYIHVVIGMDWAELGPIDTRPFALLGLVETSFVEKIVWENLPDFPMDTIYYSNVSDHKWESNFNGLKNISTNFLLRQDLEDYRVDHRNTNQNISEVTAHVSQEEARRIRFALLYENDLPFPLSNSINVFFNNEFRNQINQFTTNIDQNTAENALPYLAQQWLTKSQMPRAGTEFVKHAFQQNYFDYLIYSHLIQNQDAVNEYFKEYPDYKTALLQKIIELWEPDRGIPDLAALLAFLKKEEAVINAHHQVKLGDAEFSRQISQFIELENMLAPAYEKNDRNANGFNLPLTETTLNIHEQYRRTIYIKEYLHFSFPGLSSGELGFLTLFSRFYSLVDPLAFAGAKLEKKKLLILIDEGDLYFHPKWQVQFLDYINQIFPKIFKDIYQRQYEIQLLLTSHSPFIASDLPKDNLLFLKKGDAESRLPISKKSAAGKCCVQAGPSHTFGANVHELLSDSFFLRGAHIGQIAKETIYDLLDYLERSPNAKVYTDEQVSNIIRQIGEPWVRSRLAEKHEAFKLNGDQ